MQVRAVRGLLSQEMIYPAYYDLEVLHSSKRHCPSLAEGSDGMCPEVVESIRHIDLTLVLIFCSFRSPPPAWHASEDRTSRVNPPGGGINPGSDTPVGTGPCRLS